MVYNTFTTKGDSNIVQFTLATKKPAVQIQSASTGKLTKSQILVLAFLKSIANQGIVKTTYTEIWKTQNISRVTVYESIKALLRTGLIFI